MHHPLLVDLWQVEKGHLHPPPIRSSIRSLCRGSLAVFEFHLCCPLLGSRTNYCNGLFARVGLTKNVKMADLFDAGLVNYSNYRYRRDGVDSGRVGKMAVGTVEIRNTAGEVEEVQEGSIPDSLLEDNCFGGMATDRAGIHAWGSFHNAGSVKPARDLTTTSSEHVPLMATILWRRRPCASRPVRRLRMWRHLVWIIWR